MIWSPHQSSNLITPLSCTSVKLISKLLLMKGLNQSHFISWLNMIVPVSVVPVVRRPVSANPGLNFNLGLSLFFVFCFFFHKKHFLGQFSLFFLELSIIKLQTKRIKLTLLFKLLNLNSKFALTLGYLNPALNNPAPNRTVVDSD